jgi:ketosteroid isomerase-like protein
MDGDRHGRRGRAIEWDGIDVFPFRDGRIARKDVYSGSHAPRLL